MFLQKGFSLLEVGVALLILGLAKMLANAKFDTDTISQMTYAVVVEKRDPADFAQEWVAGNGDAVDSWLN